MDFDLSDDQEALRDGARELLDGLAAPAQVRAHADGGAAYDAALWAAMTDQGWLAIEVPEDEGGVGLGTVEVAVLADELGRHAAPAPFVPTVLAIDAFRTAGDATWVERLVTGDALACVAWDPAAPVPYAPSADVAVVLADDGVYAMELTEHPARQPAMDLTRELGWLAFDPARATKIGDDDARTRLLDRGATFTAADLLGSASRALDMAVEHAKDRVQFGRPIGSFQAVKHKCADMLVDVEGMRSTVYWAAWCIGADDPDAHVAASTAKTWCSNASKRVMSSALQVHGGIGFTWEHDLHFFMKRAQLDQLTFGDASFHRARLTALLRPRVEAGESVVERGMNFDQPPADVEWNPWGPPVRVEIEQGPVMLFARAVKDASAVYASPRAAKAAGFDRVPVPPTFTFVMASAGAFPDLQPEGGTGSMYASAGSDGDAASAFSRDGLFLHGEQHFTYHRAVCVGDVLEGRLRTSKPIARQARRGPMEVTYFQTTWTDTEGNPVVDERIVSLFFPNV